jgi:hypothetical protein
VSIGGTFFFFLECPLNNQSQIFGNVEAFVAGNLAYGIWESDVKGKTSMRAAVQNCETGKRIISIFVKDDVFCQFLNTSDLDIFEAKSAA